MKARKTEIENSPSNPLKVLFSSVPGSIIVGSLVISLSILVSSGVVRIKGLNQGLASGSIQGAQAPSAPNPNKANKDAPTEPTVIPVDPLKDEDHIKGSRDARILLIEYSDLECPFCKRFHPTGQQLVDSYKGQVAWVYRHFPLDQIHSKADKEAEAVECAKDQGGDDAFWKLTDKIFEVTPSNNGLNLDDLPKLAEEVGLNQATFKSCLDSGKYASYVEADYQGGVKAGITGTPGNILLDTKTGKTRLIPGALPFDQFKTTIDELLKS
jgi:protein-disulfide isomerase